jgi:polyketide synthase 12
VFVTVDSTALPFGPPRPERADAARNRAHLLAVARAMIDEDGVERMTMDGLAERAGLGKGTVFRRFGTRAGIFAALVDDAESALQQQVLSGPPPLGPGADPVARLIAYGRARIDFLFEHHAMARATIGRDHPVRGRPGAMSGTHLLMLLRAARRQGLLDVDDLDSLAIQLTAALEGPLLLYLGIELDPAAVSTRRPVLADSWQLLIERIMTNRTLPGAS